jgi:alpha-galactosidase
MIRFFLLFVTLLAYAPLTYAQPLQVFLLAGQSNMQGHAQVRTFEHIGMDPATKPMLDEMLNADGSPRVLDRVWISSVGCADHEQTGKLTTGFGASQNGPKIGPEYTFGITIEKYVQGTILLIKTSWGGKSLNTDFRSPSAGPYEFNETQLANFRKQGKDIEAMRAEKQMATGVNYRLMIEHVRHVLSDIKRVVPDYDASKGFELAGFVWFQGWNDMVDGSTYPQRDMPGGYDAYSHAMAHFIRDVRKDLNAPQLPFVIGVLGVNGPVSEYGADQQRYKGIHQNFRNAMAAPAALPEFQGNVAAVLTEKYWDRELSNAKSKENEVKQKAKKLASDSKLPPAEERALQEKMRNEDLTERERQVIDKGISNLEFHYLGSAKILGGIGKGLAESMADLKKLNLKSTPK